MATATTPHTFAASGLSAAVRAELICEAAREDKEWAAALHILTCGLLANTAKVWDHVIVLERPNGDICLHGLDFPAMLNEPWSSGERVLVTAAGAIFNGSVKCDLRDLGVLSDVWFHYVGEALSLRHGQMFWSIGSDSVVRDHVGDVRG